MNNKTGFLLLFLTLILIAFVSISLLKENDHDEKGITSISLKNCDIQKTVCTFNTPNLTLEISMDQDIYYLKPFNLSVKRSFTKNSGKDSSEIESIFVDFKMTNMNMGVNRFQLTKMNFKNDVYTWKGKALLPVCITGRADWVSELDILMKDSHYRLTFPILVKQAAH